MPRRLAGVIVAVLASALLVVPGGSASAAVSNVLIRGVGSGRCLTPPASSTASATIQNCASQRWSTTDAGQITINGQCLDAKGELTANGTPVITYACHGGANQRWTVNSDGTIRGAASGRCLDVKGQATAAGTVVQLYDCSAGSHQRWELVGGGTTPPPTGSGPDLSGFGLLRDYRFGTGSGRNVSNLATNFNPYGIAGTAVINNEWQRYQPFNGTNHKITSDRLELTALPNLGGVYNGGISSGQITTKETFYPRDGRTYVFSVRAKIPRGSGAWPAFWLYAKQAPNTSSEIDVVEFFDTPTQNTFDWTGYDHGAGVGSNYHSIMTNQWVWHPGFDFASDYHTYTLVWRNGQIEKWVDNTWVKGTNFTWQGSDPQLLVNLATGGSNNNNPNAATFPSVFSVDSVKVWVKCPNGSPANPTTSCHPTNG
ncbi:hypothetical protein Ais01nite_15330 [Asanoa ishikariensis]|uniref:Glycosyl hydrolases family 16 n=1 Tax=Asanoa ishikariensis TaxID=137265 RepID=A0A1H3UHP9_9ACTN|nr:ricin-type beta-trefoil lectin domain protein [Asanoa ishikariensis]GIF63498.1 hypothetical protein Ais01nite_15330 [Asanoa ishikariensis]SDZ61924.1 Glycosyl hydrolases family 16 [Asanoa ishikariensis]